MKKIKRIVLLCSAITLILLFALTSAACGMDIGGALKKVPEWIEIFGTAFKNGTAHKIIITDKIGDETTKTTIKLFENEEKTLTNYEVEEIDETGAKETFYYQKDVNSKVVKFTKGTEANSWIKIDADGTELAKYDYRSDTTLMPIMFDEYKNYVYHEEENEFERSSVSSLKVDGVAVKRVIFIWDDKNNAEARIEIGEETVERTITITVVIGDPKIVLPTTNVTDGTAANLDAVLTKIKENASFSQIVYYEEGQEEPLIMTRMVTAGERRLHVDLPGTEYSFYFRFRVGAEQWEEYNNIEWKAVTDEEMEDWLVEEYDLFKNYLLAEDKRSCYEFAKDTLWYNFVTEWEANNLPEDEDYSKFLHRVETTKEGFDAVFVQSRIVGEEDDIRYTKIKIVEDITELEGWPED